MLARYAIVKKLDENKLAKEIAKVEGMREQLSIAQIKEVLKITLDILSKKKISEVAILLERR